MKIIICICTRQRPDSLKRTLTSIAESHLEGHDIEILITANENDGTTRKALEGFVLPVPTTIIEEYRPGVAHARNAALSYILQHHPPNTLAMWTDDDVIVDRNWLTNMAQTARRYGSKYIYGGRIVPVPPEIGRKTWTQRLVTGKYKSPLYADYQPDDKTAVTDITPFGPNFAFFLSSAKKRAFSTHLGPGTNTLGEETTFLRMLVEKGHNIVYCHESIVKHMLRQEQFSESWIINRAAQWGQAVALERQRRSPARKVAARKRNYSRRLRIHQAIALLLSFSDLLSIEHKIRATYYKSFLQTIGKE